MTDLQTISAGQGVATFVPAGRVIKIEHNHDLESIDLWAFVLSKPEVRDQDNSEAKKPQASVSNGSPKNTPIKKKSKGSNLPSQQEAEEVMNQHFQSADNQPSQAKKNTWASYVPTSYVPSLGFSKKKDEQGTATADDVEGETEQQKNSRTWASYIPTGKGFGSYIPSMAKSTMSDFAKQHRRDPSKPYYEQIRAFSNTPVGAASLSAITGTGYAASLNAGYTAWSTLKKNQAEAGPTMEYLSMSHTRGSTCHLTPQTHDLLCSNLGEPVFTLLEDTSANGHDSLTAACMPAMESTEGTKTGETTEDGDEKQAASKEQGAEHDGQHTCAENLVLALGELNTHAKLPGAQAIGAAVTVHNVPPPFRLFRGIAVNAKSGALRTKPSTSGGGQNDPFVRLRAERDLVIVMSACVEGRSEGQLSEANKIEAHFFVEDPQESATKQRDRESKIQKSSAAPKKPAAAPRPTQNSSSSKASSTTVSPTTSADAAKKTKPTAGPAKLAAGSDKPKVSKTSKAGSTGAKNVSSTNQPALGNGQSSNVEQNGKTDSASPDAKKEKKKPRKLVRKEA